MIYLYVICLNITFVPFHLPFIGFRLRNVEVTVGKSLSSMKLCGFYKGPAADGEIVNIYCREPMIARYVKVMIKEKNTKDTFIHVNEIEVYSQ